MSYLHTPNITSPISVNILEDKWATAKEDEINNIEKSRNDMKKTDWYGLPSCHNVNTNITEEFRLRVRKRSFAGTKNCVCPGFMQCNLVVLKQGQEAFDFLLFKEIKNHVH